MTFGYRSDLTRFSDRVIRVQVQREALQAKQALQLNPNSPNSDAVQTNGASQSVSDELELSGLNRREVSKDYAVDLEMQQVAEGNGGEDDEPASKTTRLC